MAAQTAGQGSLGVCMGGRHLFWVAGRGCRLCALVLIGVNERGQKRFLAIEDGVRESKQSWLELLRDLKERGLKLAPNLAVGDGALGFWAALEEIFPATRRSVVGSIRPRTY